MLDIDEEEIFLTGEETQELVIGFIRHVFEEVQTEGWKTRRDKLQVDCGYWRSHDNFTDDMTFDKMLEKEDNDLDGVILSFLCKIINDLGTIWFQSWVSQARPDLDIKQRPLYWESWGWNSLNDFIYLEKIWHKKKVNYEQMREVLGLDFDLK